MGWLKCSGIRISYLDVECYSSRKSGLNPYEAALVSHRSVRFGYPYTELAESGTVYLHDINPVIFRRQLHEMSEVGCTCQQRVKSGSSATWVDEN